MMKDSGILDSRQSSKGTAGLDGKRTCFVSDRLNDGWQLGSHVFWEDYSGHSQQHGMKVGKAEAEQSGMSANYSGIDICTTLRESVSLNFAP